MARSNLPLKAWFAAILSVLSRGEVSPRQLAETCEIRRLGTARQILKQIRSALAGSDPDEKLAGLVTFVALPKRPTRMQDVTKIARARTWEALRQPRPDDELAAVFILGSQRKVRKPSMKTFDSNSPADDSRRKKSKKSNKQVSPEPNERRADELSPKKRKHQKTRRPPNVVPTRAEIMAQLARLPSMLLAGVITTAQMNSMRATLQTLLQAQNANGTATAGGRSLSVAATALRAEPRLAGLREGFLTNEEINVLVRDPGVEEPHPNRKLDGKTKRPTKRAVHGGESKPLPA
jgi:hypothetical protein